LKQGGDDGAADNAGNGGFWRVTKQAMDGTIAAREWIPTKEKKGDEVVEPLAQYPETKDEVKKRAQRELPRVPPHHGYDYKQDPSRGPELMGSVEQEPELRLETKYRQATKPKKVLVPPQYHPHHDPNAEKTVLDGNLKYNLEHKRAEKAEEEQERLAAEKAASHMLSFGEMEKARLFTESPEGIPVASRAPPLEVLCLYSSAQSAEYKHDLEDRAGIYAMQADTVHHKSWEEIQDSKTTCHRTGLPLGDSAPLTHLRIHLLISSDTSETI